MSHNYLIDHINNRIENNNTKALIDEIGKAIIELCDNDDSEVLTQALINIVNSSNVKRKYANVTKINFDILKKILFWQIQFYRLGGDIDKEVEDKYIHLWDEHVELYHCFTSGIRDADGFKVDITYRIDYSLPLADNLKALDKFVDATKISLNILYKSMEGIISGSSEKGIMPFLIFQKDVIGNESKWNKTINEWTENYCLHKLFHLLGKHKSNLVRLLIEKKVLPHLNLTEKDIPNSIHRLDKCLNEADHLIASAQKGTFPL